MTQLQALTLDLVGLREIIPFPRVDDFYDLLQDRLHMVAGSYVLQHRFTLFINALPRQELMFINRYENVPLIYAGVRRQRELLEGERVVRRQDLDEYWNFLDVTDLNSDTAVVSSQLFQAFNMGSYGLEDIPRVGMGRLEDYFESILYPGSSGKQPTPRQQAEFHILGRHFDVKADRYLSVPLVQFGEFDGIVHVVYTAEDEHNVRPRSIANLIRSFSTVLETLILEWDLLSRNFEKAKAILVPLDPVFYEKVNRNPILKELKFDEYYRRHLPFFQARIRFNDHLMHSKVYRPYLKTAIMSIMIDSFAHNVSAHSLVALNWWFKRRADNLRERRENHRAEVEEATGIVEDNLPAGFDHDRLLELITPWMRGLYPRADADEYDVVRYPGSLDPEIQPLIKFLMQKGAFWSGIARGNHFGGESASLFDVLFDDFINNPLYLGTIAKTEDIHRISLRIVQYVPSAVAPDELRHTKTVADEGVLVTIDLKHRRPEPALEPGRGYFLTCPEGGTLDFTAHPELEQMSEFVSPGEKYVALKELLRGVRVFLPGEVVGRHAFFTILENEIRNVKHFRGSALEDIQRDGLELVLAIQESSLPNGSHQGRNAVLYRIGVWINHPTDLQLAEGPDLVERKFNGLFSDIMDAETFSPRLGGGFQDKICAGMLFNNRFDRVQSGDDNAMRDRSEDTLRDQVFYPWITPAISPAAAPHDDLEVTRFNRERWVREGRSQAPESGFFKKYFHLWKAADILTIRQLDDLNFVWENLARFKFLHASLPERQFRILYPRVRNNGVIRIIDGPLQHRQPEEMLLDAYQRWLRSWLPVEPFVLQLRVDEQVVGHFDFQPGAEPVLQFVPVWELHNQSRPEQDAPALQAVDLAHGGLSLNPSQLRYRNHGIWRSYFMQELAPGQPLSPRAQLRAAELFEALTTRIVIFDNRIHGRLRDNARLDTYRQALRLSVHSESFTNVTEQGVENCCEWENRRRDVLRDCHFLIIHLSYIEKVLLRKWGNDPDYEEENIGLFIERDILPHVQHNGQVRDNFILVITTGRGRTKWWTRLKEDDRYRAFSAFTIFRPVESLISATEDALSRQDDIELKYNLVKVLFGS